MILPHQGSMTAVEFFKELHSLQQQISVTKGPGDSLGLPEGFQRTIQMIKECHEKSRKLIFIGNGGSAGIASHQAVDYWKNGKIKAITFNDASLLSCISNDYGYHRVFAEPIRQFADPGDMLIAISSSGRSRNILEAVQEARECDCKIITLSGFDSDNPLRAKGEMNFYVPSHSYGHVEVSHLCILHAMLDEIIGFSKENTSTNQELFFSQKLTKQMRP